MESTQPVNAIEIRSMQFTDLPDVLHLHQQAFPYSLNTQLGAAHLALLYEEMLRDPASMIAVAANQQTVIGVVSSTLDAVQLKRKFQERLDFQRRMSIAVRLLLRPRLLIGAFQERRLDKPVFFQNRSINGCLTAIAVHPKCRHAGIGRSLVATVEDYFKQKNERAFHLFTRADNAISREFYRHLGFIELEKRGKDILLIKELK